MSITLGLSLWPFKGHWMPPSHSTGLAGTCTPRVAKNDFIFINMFYQIEWDSQRSQGWLGWCEWAGLLPGTDAQLLQGQLSGTALRASVPWGTAWLWWWCPFGV